MKPALPVSSYGGSTSKPATWTQYIAVFAAFALLGYGLGYLSTNAVCQSGGLCTAGLLVKLYSRKLRCAVHDLGCR